MELSGKDAARLLGTCFGMSQAEINEAIGDDNKPSKCFHKGGANHDTYREQEAYVQSLGNKWASENFEATKPYFA